MWNQAEMGQYTDDVLCVFETRDGRLHFHTNDTKTNPTYDDALIIYQKGLTYPESLPTRTHHSLLSPLVIKNGDSRVNVPWRSFVWLGNYRERAPLVRPSCGRCGRCKVCNDMLPSVEDVKIVRLRNVRGMPVFGWFVVEQNDPSELVQLSKATCTAIAKQASLAGSPCNCGRCLHPVLNFMQSPKSGRETSFCELAARSFCSFRRSVKRTIELDPPTTTGRKRKAEETGTCAICLEDKQVASCCQGKACSTKLCADCHSSMRGMCPICDRAKLHSKYACDACNDIVGLRSYGAPCLECGDPVICTRCFKSFSRCSACEAKSVKRPFV